MMIYTWYDTLNYTPMPLNWFLPGAHYFNFDLLEVKRIDGVFINYILFFYLLKQIDSMFP